MKKRILRFLLILCLVSIVGCSKGSDENSISDDSNRTSDNYSEESNDINEKDNVEVLQIEASGYAETPAIEVYFEKGDGYDIELYEFVGDNSTFDVTKDGDPVVRAKRNKRSEKDILDERLNNDRLTQVDEIENNGITYYIYYAIGSSRKPSGTYHCDGYIEEYDYWISFSIHEDVSESSFSDKDEMLEDMEEAVERIQKIVVY